MDVEYFENGKVLQQHFPDLNVPSDYHGFLEPNAGVLFPENAIRVFRSLALDEGAELSVNNPVTDLDVSENSVTVKTKKGTFSADKLLLSAGAYSNKLFPQVGLDLQLQPSRLVTAFYNCLSGYEFNRLQATRELIRAANVM